MAKAAKKKAANGYKLADIIPAGEVLEDVRLKKWRLGDAVGQGGFGRIYSAQDASSSSSSFPYVIKIEPHSNGPLFVEMQFYIRNAKPEDVKEFKQEKKLKNFGMPLYLGSGSHEFKGEKYRFVVTEQFGTDLWKIFLENNEAFPVTTVFKLGIQILDVLEYIHSRGYVHADIKGANILMGKTKETKNKQVYLVDFGLATRYTTEKEFKPDPKKAHDGTIEYLSRDAHKGVQTRRGDLEILAYNMIQWLGCKLPWMTLLKNPKDVHESKEKYMKEIPKFIQICFGKRSPPGPIVDYLNYITNLEFNTEPDYPYIRKIFLSGLQSGDSLDKPFQFTSKNQTPVKRKNEAPITASPKNKKVAKSKPLSKAPPLDEEKENDMDSVEEKDSEEPSEQDETPRKGRKRNKINYNEDSHNTISARNKRLAKPKPHKKTLQSEDEEDDDMVEKNDTEEAIGLDSKPRRGRKKNKGNHKDDSNDVPLSRNKNIAKSKPVKESASSEDEKENTLDSLEAKELKEDFDSDKEDLDLLSTRGKKTVKSKHNKDPVTSEDEMENDIDSVEAKDLEEATEPDETSRRGRVRNKINYKEDSDNESKKSKRKLGKKAKAKSVEDLHVTGDSLDGYTDAMKEVLLKKQQKTKRKKKNEEEINDSEDDNMHGYTDEMKEIAAKKKSSKKGKNVTSNKVARKNKVEVTNGDPSDTE